MNDRFVAVFGAVLVLALSCSAQKAKRDHSHSSPRPEKITSVSGKVGPAGKTFVVNKHAITWTVADPETLVASEGTYVTVRARMDSAAHTLRVIAVEFRASQGARLEDTAFRR
jgi:hypothetical protein